jgi:hypothetical protein
MLYASVRLSLAVSVNAPWLAARLGSRAHRSPGNSISVRGTLLHGERVCTRVHMHASSYEHRAIFLKLP